MAGVGLPLGGARAGDYATKAEAGLPHSTELDRRLGWLAEGFLFGLSSDRMEHKGD